MKVKPFTFEQARAAVSDAVARSQPRHEKWRALESLLATGADLPTTAGVQAVRGDVVTRIPESGVNLLLPHVTMLAGSVTDRDPQFGCEPLGYGDGIEDDAEDEAARAAEALVSYWFRVAEGRTVLQQMTRDMVVLGPGFCKVGWRFVEVDAPRPAGDVASEIAELAAQNPDTDADELASQVTLTTTMTTESAPFIEYVSPYDLYADRAATTVYDARWTAHRVIKPADELREDLELSDTVALTPYSQATVTARATHAGVDLLAAEPFALVEVYEFYDMRTRRMMVFQLNSAEALYSGPIPFSHRRSPFIHMTNYRRNPYDFYGFGDLENVAGLHNQVNDLLERQLDNASRSGAKVIADSRLLTDEVQEALASPEHGEVIGVDTNGTDLASQMVVVPNPPTPADVYQANAELQDLIARTLGITELQQGRLSAGNRVSGTAAAAVEGNSNIRTADKQAAVADAAGRIGALILELCSEFMEEPLALRIAGQGGQRYLRQVSADHVSGRYQVTVEVGSTARVNPIIREQRAIEMAQTIIPMLTSLGYDPDRYVREVLRDLRWRADWLVRPEQAPVPEAPAPGLEGAGSPEEQALLEQAMPGMAGPGMPEGGLPPELAQMLAQAGAVPTDGGLPATPEELGLPASPEALGMDLAGDAQARGGFAF